MSLLTFCPYVPFLQIASILSLCTLPCQHIPENTFRMEYYLHYRTFYGILRINFVAETKLITQP